MSVALTVSVQQSVQVSYLQAECGVRYWEDATVNGEADEDGSRIPFRKADAWCPLIELSTGLVMSWPAGTTADIHYKICDDGAYHLLDAAFNTVKRIDGYVPKIMCPGDDGFGDYVIMKIDGNGQIEGWKPDLRAFEKNDWAGLKATVDKAEK